MTFLWSFFWIVLLEFTRETFRMPHYKCQEQADVDLWTHVFQMAINKRRYICELSNLLIANGWFAIRHRPKCHFVAAKYCHVSVRSSHVYASVSARVVLFFLCSYHYDIDIYVFNWIKRAAFPGIPVMCVCVEIRWTFDSSTCVSNKNGIRLSIFRTYINFASEPFHSWRLCDSALRKRSDGFIYTKCFRESEFFINDFLMSPQIDFWCQNR